MEKSQPEASKLKAIKEEKHPYLQNAHSPWKLTWSEEFHSEEVDTDKWNLLDDAFGHGERNQHYKPENIAQDRGILTIDIKKEKSSGLSYTSGAMTTKGKVSFLYGKIEIRAKLPAGKGFLPAIWLWNESGETFPEIDIVEIEGSKPDEVWNVVHYEQLGQYKRDFTMTRSPGITDDFHVYGVEWLEDRIDFFIDGELVFSSTKHIPEQEMYLFINAAVGGTWVGEPDSTTQFPSQMKVDWVRYYEKNKE